MPIQEVRSRDRDLYRGSTRQVSRERKAIRDRRRGIAEIGSVGTDRRQETDDLRRPLDSRKEHRRPRGGIRQTPDPPPYEGTGSSCTCRRCTTEGRSKDSEEVRE